MSDRVSFEYSNRPLDVVPQSGALVLVIPRGVLQKGKLFEIYSRGLRFPPYFGEKWDAFEECLGDLSWLKRPTKVYVLHESHPFTTDSQDLKTYLQILKARTEDTTVLQLEFHMRFALRHRLLFQRILAN